MRSPAASAYFVHTALLGGCAAEESFTAQTYTAEGEVVSVAIDVSDRAVEVAPSVDCNNGDVTIDLANA